MFCREGGTWSAPEHGEVRPDLLCTEGLQQRGTLVGPQRYPLPLGWGFVVRAFPRACLGHAPSVGLHQLLQAGVHLLWVHAVHHLRVHATLHLQADHTALGGARGVVRGYGAWLSDLTQGVARDGSICATMHGVRFGFIKAAAGRGRLLEIAMQLLVALPRSKHAQEAK